MSDSLLDALCGWQFRHDRELTVKTLPRLDLFPALLRSSFRINGNRIYFRAFVHDVAWIRDKSVSFAEPAHHFNPIPIVAAWNDSLQVHSTVRFH